MKRGPVVMSVVAAFALVTAHAASAEGNDPSCVGQFASQAGEHVGEFSALISDAARNDQPNFGRGTVAPFAHEPRSACP